MDLTSVFIQGKKFSFRLNANGIYKDGSHFNLTVFGDISPTELATVSKIALAIESILAPKTETETNKYSVLDFQDTELSEEPDACEK